MKTLKEQIINHLELSGESVQDFSRRAGVNYSTVYRYLNGSRSKGPYTQTAEKLYKAISKHNFNINN